MSKTKRLIMPIQIFFIRIVFFHLRFDYAYVFCTVNLEICLNHAYFSTLTAITKNVDPSKKNFNFILNLSKFSIILSSQNAKHLLIAKVTGI